MISQRIKIQNPSGLHLRPAGILCNEAIKYKASTMFSFGGNITNLKSVLSVLGACIKFGDEIELICDGEDEEEAMEGLAACINNRLGE